ncbi:Carboxylesterase [Handroanthus impetiginosus]|uniref:Carboxylesterase n=1 Tax=Handroanthus impetiginosus TaxID=429701 RepID=A0A2G9GI00_9LAMI|nr:Carboxylesterase [Handroanthus impetiginosus]
MMRGRLGENLGLKEEIIQKACRLSMKAHEKSPAKPYIHEKTRGSTEVFFAFCGSWRVGDWCSTKPFGEVKVNRSRFPSMKSVGNEEIALVNEAFSRRFDEILSRSSLATEVEKAISDRKQIVFAGHSSGGPVAILAAIWFFEKYIRFNHCQTSPFCLTFGSPLAGDHIFSHALRRENWARYFIHFVMKHDIIPRIMLTPLPDIEQGLQHILDFLCPKSPFFLDNSTASDFLLSVMRNCLSVASRAACYLKGCTNLLLETVASIVELSPYRPFGVFVFCTGSGKLVVLDNPDAVLQLLFFCLQMNPEEENPDFVQGMFKEHLMYESELLESLNMQDVTYLVNLADVPLSADARTDDAAALNDLGLSTRARLCLRAAGELEKQKQENQRKIDSNKDAIKEALEKLQEYRTSCEIRRVGYYDAFKTQRDKTDFDANINRVELAGIWDEIIEMIKRYELPDGFEGRKEWIELGTLFRRLMEPLDIANYYGHLLNEDTGPYMVKARPKRYRFTQKWREHAERMPVGLSSETTFWAEVEELRVKPYDRVKDKVLRLEEQVLTWVGGGMLGKDVFLDESTFTKWWKTLPFEHRSSSCIAGLIKT